MSRGYARTQRSGCWCSARFAIDDDQAFRMLVSSFQETNIKLVDVSRWLASEAAQGRSQPAEPARSNR